jgi:hypothetical protein
MSPNAFEAYNIALQALPRKLEVKPEPRAEAAEIHPPHLVSHPEVFNSSKVGIAIAISDSVLTKISCEWKQGNTCG